MLYKAILCYIFNWCLLRGSARACRGGCSQPTIGLSTGSPMEELEKGLKELKGFVTHGKNNNINQPDFPRVPRD